MIMKASDHEQIKTYVDRFAKQIFDHVTAKNFHLDRTLKENEQMLHSKATAF